MFMLLQLLNDDRALFLAFHFFIAGVITGILLMRSKLKAMKEMITELERELHNQYEENVMQLKN